jgi:hypothetical protein
MKNREDNNKETEEVKVVKVTNHFGGKHKTFHYSDGSTCNVYADGYKSNADSVIKTFSSDTMNTDTTVTATKSAKAPKAKAPKATKAKAKKPTKKVDTEVTAPVAADTTTKKVSRADVKVAVENFLKNPPDKPLTLAQVYETIGFAHRQVYMMVREHGVAAGKADSDGKGRKETLFTFNKVA